MKIRNSMCRAALLCVCLLTFSSTAPALTDFDYSLGKSKYGSSSIVDYSSFHGSRSAMLSVLKGGTTVRAYIYMDEPIPIKDLDTLNMWINPQNGDGYLQLQLFLDGDGDGKYESKNPEDLSLRSSKSSWSTLGMSEGQWSELDGFDLIFTKDNDVSFGSRSLDECRKSLTKSNLVKLYITFYKDPDKNVNETRVLLDFIAIADELISFEPLEQEKIKKATKSVSQGGTITYTITYGNNLQEPTDLVVREQYDRRTIFLEASPPPDPGTNNVWTFPNLAPGKHGQIVIKMSASKSSCRARIEGEAEGTGYTAASAKLSTSLPGYTIANSVILSSEKFNLTASASTVVKPREGLEMLLQAGGAGASRSWMKLDYSPTKISALWDLTGKSSAVSAKVNGREIPFTSRWHAAVLWENRARDLLWDERYWDSSRLNLSFGSQISKNSASTKSVSDFSGFHEQLLRWTGAASTSYLAGNFSLQRKMGERMESHGNSGEKEGLGCLCEGE
jgi:hypothetical protein